MRSKFYLLSFYLDEAERQGMSVRLWDFIFYATFGLVFTIFFFYGYGDHRDLHSFPTRRSSDLPARQRPGLRRAGHSRSPAAPPGRLGEQVAAAVEHAWVLVRAAWLLAAERASPDFRRARRRHHRPRPGPWLVGAPPGGQCRARHRGGLRRAGPGRGQRPDRVSPDPDRRDPDGAGGPDWQRPLALLHHRDGADRQRHPPWDRRRQPDPLARPRRLRGRGPKPPCRW